MPDAPDPTRPRSARDPAAPDPTSASADSASAHPRGSAGSLAAELSNAMVQIVRRYAGRGPTRARASVGRDHVIIILRDTLTTSERTLRDHGDTALVLETRKALQNAMRDEATAMIERLTGRSVIGFMSDNHIDPDLACEVFVLEPADTEDADLAEAEAAA